MLKKSSLKLWIGVLGTITVSAHADVSSWDPKTAAYRNLFAQSLGFGGGNALAELVALGRTWKCHFHSAIPLRNDDEKQGILFSEEVIEAVNHPRAKIATSPDAAYDSTGYLSLYQGVYPYSFERSRIHLPDGSGDCEMTLLHFFRETGDHRLVYERVAIPEPACVPAGASPDRSISYPSATAFAEGYGVCRISLIDHD